MIIGKGSLPSHPRSADQAARMGRLDQVQLSDAGGLTQFGLYAETLYPGARSSQRHWHEEEDELLYMLEGEAVLIENDGRHVLRAGDAVAWKAGVANGHQIVNRSDAPCTYLIMGTRVSQDVVHYPDEGQVMYHRPPDWWVEDADGVRIRGGKV
jgi:uncharacterized cupin superfamily protein